MNFFHGFQSLGSLEVLQIRVCLVIVELLHVDVAQILDLVRVDHFFGHLQERSSPVVFGLVLELLRYFDS